MFFNNLYVITRCFVEIVWLFDVVCTSSVDALEFFYARDLIERACNKTRGVRCSSGNLDRHDVYNFENLGNDSFFAMFDNGKGLVMFIYWYFLLKS